MQFLSEWFKANPYAGLLITLMAFDVLMGILRAIQDRALSSNIAGKGMRRKAVQLILILVGESLEKFVGNSPISEFIAVTFCVAEGMSIIENANLLGVKVPDVISRAFASLGSGMPKEHQSRPDVIEESLDRVERDGL